MSTLILKSFNHLLKLLKIYSLFALIGVLLVLAYGLITEFPNLSGVTLLVIGGLYIVTKLMAHTLNREAPPALADIFLYLLLPAPSSTLILADLHQIYRTKLETSRSQTLGQWRMQAAKFRIDLWYCHQILRSIRPLISIRRHEYKLSAQLDVRLRQVLPFYQE